MVSALWKACSEGDAQTVHEILKDASSLDVEVKDHTGATPLIQAIRNGHVHIVKSLLEKGADPMNSSGQARPEQYTNDAVILELLASAREKRVTPDTAPSAYPQPDGYSQVANSDPSKTYYAQPPAPYIYYPAMHPGATMMSDGSMPYYASPPLPSSSGHNQPDAGGLSNLPPPEIARMIPCRYFPACRYGASCMFAHPQGPYFQGPLPPPAQYPISYDHMTQPPYSSGYYAMSPSAYPPNGLPPHANPMSPPPASHHTPTPPLTHARSTSDVVSPVQLPFSPGAPPSLPYGVVSPMSPSYSQPGQMAVPMGIPPLPPLHHPHPADQRSPPAVYQSGPAGTQGAAPPMGHHRDSSVAHPQNMGSPGGKADPNHLPLSPSLTPQTDGYGPSNPPPSREMTGHARRGSMRRTSVGFGRKPPCLFFPSGRCRNGDECRFPHVISDGAPPGSHHPSKYGSRIRPHHNSNAGSSIEEKMSSLSVQENGTLPSTVPHADGESGGVPRQQNGFKPNHLTNGVRQDKRNLARQRVPNADDFPVLVGSTTPPSRSPGFNGSSGPTAAQVLQAPPPARPKDNMTNGDTSDPGYTTPSGKEDKPFSETNGVNGSSHDSTPSKHPTSFAAVATAASSHPDASNQVSVAA